MGKYQVGCRGAREWVVGGEGGRWAVLAAGLSRLVWVESEAAWRGGSMWVDRLCNTET